MASLSFSYFNIEFLQEYLKFILSRKAGIDKESALRIPFLEPSVIKELMLLVYNERDDIMLQALAEHNESADSTVSVLEGMYSLKCYVEGEYIL